MKQIEENKMSESCILKMKDQEIFKQKNKTNLSFQRFKFEIRP